MVACDVCTREAETTGSLGLTGTASLSYLGISSSLRSPVSKSKVNHWSMGKLPEATSSKKTEFPHPHGDWGLGGVGGKEVRD